MKIYLGFIFVLIFVLTPSDVFSAKEKDKFSCNKTELQTKSCVLKLLNYNLQLTPEKILISDGVFRNIKGLPVKGEKVEWVRVNTFRAHKRVFVELLMWGLPIGEANVQSLYWTVSELKGVKLSFLIYELVQKRRLIEAENGKTLILYDPRSPFGIKVDRKGKLIWHVKNRKGIF